MRAFCFSTGRNEAKQHSSVVDWSWLNKNMKDRLLNCFMCAHGNGIKSLLLQIGPRGPMLAPGWPL